MNEAFLQIKANEIKNSPYVTHGDPTFIPVRLIGGIGDVIMSGVVIEELRKKYSVVPFTNHIETYCYFHPEPVLRSIPNFTWYLELNTVARFKFSEQFRGFTCKEHEQLFLQQQEVFKRDPRLWALVRNHPNYDFELAEYARDKADRRTFPFLCLGLEIPKAVKRERKQKWKIITIHDGYDTSNFWKVENISTKQWPMKHWEELVARLKSAYPEYRIIQLGAKTGRPISGVDECLINQTTIVQAFELISHSSIHIDGDSGLAHAATFQGVPCVVMFGPTPDHFFGYEQNGNLRSKLCSRSCFWATDTWMSQCPIGLPEARCMREIDAEQVFGAAKGLLEKKEVPVFTRTSSSHP